MPEPLSSFLDINISSRVKTLRRLCSSHVIYIKYILLTANHRSLSLRWKFPMWNIAAQFSYEMSSRLSDALITILEFRKLHMNLPTVLQMHLYHFHLIASPNPPDICDHLGVTKSHGPWPMLKFEEFDVWSANHSMLLLFLIPPSGLKGFVRTGAVGSHAASWISRCTKKFETFKYIPFAADTEYFWVMHTQQLQWSCFLQILQQQQQQQHTFLR
jgi:hypothetical protein